MACLEQGELLAYLDDELSPRRRQQVVTHLEVCLTCRAMHQSLQQDRQVVQQALDQTVAATGKSPVNLDLAWKRFVDGRVGEDDNNRSVKMMKSTWLRPLVAGFLGVALVGSLTLPPVRAAASNLLSALRVEKLQIINFSPSDLQELQKVLQDKGGSLNIKDFGEVKVTSGRQESKSVTWDEANRLAGFKLAVPPLVGPRDHVYFSSGMDVEIKPQVEPINQLLRSMGGNAFLPTELSGQTFLVKMPPMVAAKLVNEDNVTLTYVQTVSPQIAGPAKVDVEQIRQAVLAIPALPQDLRRQLQSIKDWQQVLPVPMQQDASRTVTVQGAPGVVGRTVDDQLILVWQKDGVIRFVTGSTEEAKLLAMAEGLK